MLHPQRLLVLRAVIAAGSVSEAARNLSYAPATVSQHLAALARETGLTLFERSGRGIAPTGAAIQLADSAESVLDGLDLLDRTVADLRDLPAEHLAIACFSSVAQAWLPALVRRLRARHPRLRIEISSNEPLDGRGRHRPDIDIRTEPEGGPTRQREGEARHPLLFEEFLVVLREDHRLAGRDAIPLVELNDEDWVDHDIYDSPTGQIISTATRTAGFTPHYAARLDDHHAALALVAAGVGITVLPRLATGGLPSGLRAVPLIRPTMRRRIVAYSSATVSRRHALIASALVMLKEAAGDSEA